MGCLARCSTILFSFIFFSRRRNIHTGQLHVIAADRSSSLLIANTIANISGMNESSTRGINYRYPVVIHACVSLSRNESFVALVCLVLREKKKKEELELEMRSRIISGEIMRTATLCWVYYLYWKHIPRDRLTEVNQPKGV